MHKIQMEEGLRANAERQLKLYSHMGSWDTVSLQHTVYLTYLLQ